jgi:hypothetical protein
MSKILSLVLIGSLLLASNYTYNGSTTAVVTLAGAVIKAKHIDKEKKYPRKDCPVCKGTGKYLSGDGIKMVDCGYCEAETKDAPLAPAKNKECDTQNCKPPQPPQKTIIIR